MATVRDAAAAVDFGLAAIAMLFVTVALLAWSGARDLWSTALFIGAMVSMLLVFALLRYETQTWLPRYTSIFEVSVTAALVIGLTLLGACGIISAWSLVTRRPLRDSRGVAALLVYGLAPVVMYAWAIIVIGFLALGGF
jgi:hypothetical protein